MPTGLGWVRLHQQSMFMLCNTCRCGAQSPTRCASMCRIIPNRPAGYDLECRYYGLWLLKTANVGCSSCMLLMLCHYRPCYLVHQLWQPAEMCFLCLSAQMRLDVYSSCCVIEFRVISACTCFCALRMFLLPTCSARAVMLCLP